MSNQERTEQATPKKQQDLRKKGQVAKSQDLMAAISLLGMTMVLLMLSHRTVEQMISFLEGYLFNIDVTTPLEEQSALFPTILGRMFGFLWPILGAAMLLGLVGNLVQTGFIYSIDPLKPKLSNLNPLSGIKKMFSMKTLVNTLKTLLKFAVIATGAWLALYPELELLYKSPYNDLWGMYETLSRVIGVVVVRIAIMFFVIGFFDFLYQRYDFKKQNKMTKQDVKQEFKNMEGDPLIKGKLQERRRQMASGRMIDKVPEATLVITNPTHYAIAIQFKQLEMSAPIVVAKGTDDVALRIRQIAQDHGVPCFERPQLARALYKTSMLDEEIPVEMYQFIAELLATIYAGQKGGAVS